MSIPSTIPQLTVPGATEEIYLLHLGALIESSPRRRMWVPAPTHGMCHSSIGAPVTPPLAAEDRPEMTITHAIAPDRNPWYPLQLSAEGMKMVFLH